jgi:hypothetical protein
MKNVFVDDRGFPDISDAYDTLLHNVNGGPVLRKLKHPPPTLDVADPLSPIILTRDFTGQFFVNAWTSPTSIAASRILSTQ